MEFRVLGPLQVVDAGRTVALGGPMQRAVLALLVLEPNRVVSMEQLIYQLWGDDSPARAVGTVQAYVSNLRRALEPARRVGEPARVLISRPPGYELQVAADDVDWVRFERLVEQAREARDAGNLPAADALLVEARALWRGPPLADLPAIATHERARLEGVRLSAFEEHAEVLLALGRHDDVVDDIDAVAAEHPLRERLRGLQMVALYRAGRQVEALDVYTDVRGRLAEEHGLDPGADLRRLHDRIPGSTRCGRPPRASRLARPALPTRSWAGRRSWRSSATTLTPSGRGRAAWCSSRASRVSARPGWPRRLPPTPPHGASWPCGAGASKAGVPLPCGPGPRSSAPPATTANRRHSYP